MLLVQYIYSLVVLVVFASSAAMVQVGYILEVFSVGYFVIYMSLGPAALCHVNNAATYTSVSNQYIERTGSIRTCIIIISSACVMKSRRGFSTSVLFIDLLYNIMYLKYKCC